MKQSTYVWDPLVRVFHWGLVLTFLISYLTGDELETIHAYSGYLILSLISVRILWGFVGTKHARFSDFVRPVSEARGYLRDLLTGNAKKYTGHNPAGGLMILALLSSLAITGLTGLKAYGEEGYGPLASTPVETVSSLQTSSISANSNDDHDDDDDDQRYKNGKSSKHDDEENEVWEELHEFFANFTVLLVMLHILGVYISSFLHKENLVNAMITGYKESSKK